MIKSIHEVCPNCHSSEREFVGVEANFSIDDVWEWKCRGCGDNYDTPVPPYDDDFSVVVDAMSAL